MKLYLKKTEFSLSFPFWQLSELFADQPCGALLDSGMGFGNRGRFSFSTARPTALLTAKRMAQKSQTGKLFQMDLSRWRSIDGTKLSETLRTQFIGHPFEALRELQTEYGLLETQVSEFPFTGGLIGYLSYETGHAMEFLPDTGLDDLNLPDLAFMVVDEVFVYDHVENKSSLWVTGRGGTQELARQEADLRSSQLLELINGWSQEAVAQVSALASFAGQISSNPKIRAHFTRETYMEAVELCRQHILAGDLFEICLTHRMEADLEGSAWDLFQRLRQINPAPFASFLHFDGFEVVSASPERFLKLDKNKQAESRPIKGTRPRGDNPWDDQRLREELQTSEKDRAENVMIVDLVRNDLGKVSEIGSIEVPELLVVEPYATVFQLVSTITGQLRPQCDAFDLVQACFPGGSMTGAPKIEAMKIIDKIEPVKRGVYSGAIGYFDRSGALDLSIVIRTIVCKDGQATFGVGGAIVSDSDPAAEYQETLDKANALMQALGVQL